jgi:dynein heavy chain 1
LTLDIRIRNQVIYPDPPIEFARRDWLDQLEDFMGVICNLGRVRSSRYEISLQVDADDVDLTYATLVEELDGSVLARALIMIEDKIRLVGAYVDKWLGFQALWDLEAESIYIHLGDSLAAWSQLLYDIRQARSTFDTTDTRKDFGVCIVDYTNAQSKVNAKYDAWQKELLSRYGSRLGTSMKESYGSIQKARSDLEIMSIEGGSTAQAVSFITFVQDLNRKVQIWGPDIEQFVIGQKTLERQRYAFAPDWLFVDQIQGEWSAFCDILKRKNDSIKEQVGEWRLMCSHFGLY